MTKTKTVVLSLKKKTPDGKTVKLVMKPSAPEFRPRYNRKKTRYATAAKSNKA